MTQFPQAGFEPLSEADGLEGTFTTRVPASSACFDGHFDGAPILPGVAQLALVLEACAERAGRRCVFSGVRDVRWRRPILPGDEMTITLTDGAVPSAVRFSIRCGDEVASTGTVVLASSEGGSVV